MELTERALERIAATDGELRAWALVDADGARAQAETARARAERGNPGPLHGLPVGVKDLIDVAGLPTGGGSKHLSADRAGNASRPPTPDARPGSGRPAP